MKDFFTLSGNKFKLYLCIRFKQIKNKHKHTKTQKMADNTAYIGKKGYTLNKSTLTQSQQSALKKELTAAPFVNGSCGVAPSEFPIYRETQSKFYVPRYYGSKKFGEPMTCKLPAGADINVSFSAALRENQIPVVAAYLKHVEDSCNSGCNSGGGGLLELPCAYGKTVISIYLIAALKKKTLIIVHKEFLMNQWIERLGQFLPSARIGKIQGQILDIENKDVVIGMLQSLSMKDYHENTFDSFGLTVIDEVHHISSEVFSRSLFKIVTRYTLGLSATMNRKDGMTKVFKMFLGDVVYKGKRDEDHKVVVRGIEYVSSDPQFREVATDFRGNVAYSTMISKLCACSHRTEFILKVLVDMVAENPKQQIMILGHNRNLLTYIYDAICFRNISDVGYYLGGMKEKALKETETKRVIIATYSMAAEALDIKTLTTLIMATPKTDIEQAVGRILRDKHGSPMVVDIIDEHRPFKNQWAKRKSFYKKQHYTVLYTKSTRYTGDTTVWRNEYGVKEVDDEPTECLLNPKIFSKMLKTPAI